MAAYLSLVALAATFCAERRPERVPVRPAAQCADGGYSFGEGAGTCSYHGGVARRLR